MKPILKQISSYPGYYAGDDGGIYSDHTNKRWGHNKPPRKLVPGRQTNGYLMVTLVHPEGGYRSQRVHTLVCEAFHGPRPEGTDCSHKDDDKENNVPSNLCWETPLENQRRRHENGIDDRGLRNSRSIGETKLKLIKDLINNGATNKEVAQVLDISTATVSRIRTGRRYQDNG